MPPRLGATIVKLALLSLIVGLVLRAIGFTPRALIEHFGETVQGIFTFVVSTVEWAVPYILLGAVIVVPLWLIRAGFLFNRNRKGS